MTNDVRSSLRASALHEEQTARPRRVSENKGAAWVGKNRARRETRLTYFPFRVIEWSLRATLNANLVDLATAETS